VLELSDGLNTVRDITFLLGRGLFAVTLDVAHLADVGLLEIAAPAVDPGTSSGHTVRPAPAPARPTGGVLALLARRWPRPDPTPSADVDPGEGLPRRVPGGRSAERQNGTRLS
jgi:hypothetical protein